LPIYAGYPLSEANGNHSKGCLVKLLLPVTIEISSWQWKLAPAVKDIYTLFPTIILADDKYR
jgi:hypothetical protein